MLKAGYAGQTIRRRARRRTAPSACPEVDCIWPSSSIQRCRIRLAHAHQPTKGRFGIQQHHILRPSVLARRDRRSGGSGLCRRAAGLYPFFVSRNRGGSARATASLPLTSIRCWSLIHSCLYRPRHSRAAISWRHESVRFAGRRRQVKVAAGPLRDGGTAASGSYGRTGAWA